MINENLSEEKKNHTIQITKKLIKGYKNKYTPNIFRNYSFGKKTNNNIDESIGEENSLNIKSKRRKKE